MTKLYVLFLLLFLLTLSCKKPAETSNASAYAKRYPFKGKVVAVDKTAKKATIEHDAVADYMPGMTMEFPIRADWAWNDLTVGSELRAELVIDNGAKEPFWLENIGIIASAKPGQPEPTENPNFAQVGREIPDFSLTNQDGKQISVKGFRGKALAITFIYSRCPLPNYCIRMSTNFSDTAGELGKDPAAKQKYALLSISFDPANDTPAKLRSYGLGYMGKEASDLGVWQLAVGKEAEVRRIADFFGLRYEVDPNDKAQINHSLRTAVISPEGKVSKIFAGNEWTPKQLLAEMNASLSSQNGASPN